MGSNMHRQPPSMTVIPYARPYSAAAWESLPIPGPRCIHTCLTPARRTPAWCPRLARAWCRSPPRQHRRAPISRSGSWGRLRPAGVRADREHLIAARTEHIRSSANRCPPRRVLRPRSARCSPRCAGHIRTSSITRRRPLAMSTQTGSTVTARIGATSIRGEGRGRLAGAGGYPQKMQVGSRSISVSRSSTRFDCVSGS